MVAPMTCALPGLTTTFARITNLDKRLMNSLAIFCSINAWKVSDPEAAACHTIMLAISRPLGEQNTARPGRPATRLDMRWGERCVGKGGVGRVRFKGGP